MSYIALLLVQICKFRLCTVWIFILIISYFFLVPLVVNILLVAMATFKKAFLKSIFDKINMIYILIYTSCVLSPKGCNIIPLMTEGPYETLWTLTNDRSFVSSRCRSSLDITMWCGNTWLATPSLWEPCLVIALRVLLLLLVITMFTIQWEGCVAVRINKFKSHCLCYLGFYGGMLVMLFWGFTCILMDHV